MERWKEVIDGGSIRVRSDDLDDLEKRDAKGQIFLTNLLNNAPIVWPRTTKYGRVTRVGRGVF